MPQSNEVGADWFEKAATAGDPEAQFLYAVSLAEGRGRERNLELAFSWAQKSVAASMNEPEEIRAEREGLRNQLEQMLYSSGNTESATQVLAARDDPPVTAAQPAATPSTSERLVPRRTAQASAATATQPADAGATQGQTPPARKVRRTLRD